MPNQYIFGTMFVGVTEVRDLEWSDISASRRLSESESELTKSGLNVFSLNSIRS